MKKIFLLSVFTASLFANGANLYNACKVCHGIKAEKSALGKSKIVASLTKAEFIANMKGYRDGSYGGVMKAIMIQQSKKLSDTDIIDLASYIQSIK